MDSFKRHLKSNKHLEYAQSVRDTQKVEVKLTSNQLNFPIQRRSRLHTGDIVVCKKLLFSFLQHGIPLGKLDYMRECLEDLTSHSIGRSWELKSDYVPVLTDAEDSLQSHKIRKNLRSPATNSSEFPRKQYGCKSYLRGVKKKHWKEKNTIRRGCCNCA